MKKIKRFLIPLFFVILCIIFLTSADKVFYPKNIHYYKYNHILYSEDKEIVNVGFFGGSHAYNAFCPGAMYYSNGVKAYNYSSSGQPLFLTYYLMKEVIATGKPEIAVVDLYYLGLENEYFSRSSYLRSVIDNLASGQNKTDAINNCVAPDERSSYYFRFIQYHDRWSELTVDDFTGGNESKTIDYSNLGWGYNAGGYGQNMTELSATDERAEIPEKSLYYLNEIISLCKSNDVKLIFTSLPHDYAETNHPDDWVSDEAAMFNTASDIAAENDIPFIQFNNVLDEMNFDFKEDMHNSSHVTYSGAIKVSEYIAEFIAENYELKDLSSIQSDTWEKYSANYEKAFSN